MFRVFARPVAVLRRPLQCSVDRWYRKSSWEPWEDQLLKDYVHANGPRWKDAARHVLPHRTADGCGRRYREVLDPSICRGRLTEDERALFAKGLEEFGTQYALIAKHYLPQRTPRALYQAWKTSMDPRLAKGRWTPQEDATLLQAVGKLGKQWMLIQENHLPHRSGAAIRTRYMENLAPDIKHTPWTIDELHILLRRSIRLGISSWAKLADDKELPGRPPTQCRLAYDNYLRPTNHHDNELPADMDLRFWEAVHLYAKSNYGKDLWAKVAATVNLSVSACRIRFRDDKRIWQIMLGHDAAQRTDESPAGWMHRLSGLVVDQLQKGIRVKPNNLNSQFHISTVASRRKKEPDTAITSQQRRERWTDEEDALLHAQLRQQEETRRMNKDADEDDTRYTRDWTAVARALTEHGFSRSPKQCMGHYHSLLQRNADPAMLKHKRLSDDEISLLFQGIDMFGHDWDAIAKTYLPQRSPDRLKRWYKWHQHHETHGSWTPDASEQLQTLVTLCQEQPGPSSTSEKDALPATIIADNTDWAKVARMMGSNRTGSACRQHWLALNPPKGFERGKRPHWTPSERIKLMNLVQNINPNTDTDWQQVAHELNTGRSAKSCQLKHRKIVGTGALFG
ncbi:hypothetical protein BC940DRAFT_295502 [Gongronella butleri]|nr:hypothetical protein BC940DRAFT_295502 [Gongronella butleri]